MTPNASATPAVRVIRHKHYIRAFAKLTKKAQSTPVAQTVVEQCEEILWAYRKGETLPKKITENGETRIPNAFKFDLAGRYRLVIQRVGNGALVALFVGDHQDADKWLDQNRGQVFEAVREVGGVVACEAMVSRDAEEARERADSLDDPDDVLAIDQIGDRLFEELGVKPALIQRIRRDASQVGSSVQEIVGDIELLGFGDEFVKCAVLDCVQHLAKGEIDLARNRLKIERARRNDLIDTSPNAFVEALRRGAGGQDLVLEGVVALETLEHVVEQKNFQDWLLFLHPDQTAVVSKNYNGPARLLGVAGSGKTCVLIHRAARLAREHPNERILVLTYNQALSHLLEYLLECLCTDDAAANIDVMSVEDYLKQMVRKIEPLCFARLNARDEKSGEDIVACWKDFSEKAHGLPSVSDLVEAIESFGERPPEAAAYLYDELAWIRSGFGLNERKDYLEATRSGRGLNFPTASGGAAGGFEVSTRAELLKLLANFEEYMWDGHLVDREGITQEAYRLREKIVDHDNLRYRCVLVDEYQDLSTLEMALLRHVPTSEENGLYFVGDPVQKIFPRHHDLKRVDINFKGRSSNLKRNFRNTRRILEAAQAMIEPYLRPDSDGRPPISEADITPPEYAVQRGDVPTIFRLDSPEQQLRLVLGITHMMREYEWHSVAVCSHSLDTIHTVETMFKKEGVPAQRLGPGVNFIDGGVKLAHIDDIKGYEFSTVLLLDLSDPKRPKHDGYPSASVSWPERWRDAMRIYVAMTRARDNLYLAYIDNPSILLREIWDAVEEENDPESWC